MTRDRIREAWATGNAVVSDEEVEENLADWRTHALAEAMEDRALSGQEMRGLNRYRKRFNIS